MEKSKSDLVGYSADQAPLKLLRLKQVQATTGMCKSQIYLLQKQKRFPASVCLSGSRGEHAKRGSTAWLDHEVQAWIESRVKATRDGDGGAK